MKQVIGILASAILATGPALACDEKAHKSFDTLDSDRNGVVTREELATETKLLTRFELADSDQDGMLTYSEFESIRDEAETTKEAE